MSVCVNLNSKEFKDCCKRLNVAAATLEPIIHEFINIKGNENSFPSDNYISDIINGKESSVLSDEQIKLYEEKYSQSKAFTNPIEAEAYRQELLQFFPKESIGFKETLSGLYEVKVANLVSDNTLKEIQSIKEKAIANGTFMKAPNGQPTNLTERQWLHVRTKAFKRWFGDWENDPENASRVVDENGEPLVVYHGGAPGITEFRTSTENSSNTGYGFYTDKQTGEKIPVDSARAMFFSNNKHVAKSYAQLYALQYFRELREKTQSAISTFYEGKASIEKDVFKTIDEFYDFLTIVSEFNPRFKKLRDYLKDIKSRGQKIKSNEVEEARKLFIELRSNLDKYTKDWNLNSSSWDNALEVGTNIINEYNSKEGIQRLKSGEIPEHIKKEWELYNKIQNHRKKHGLPEIGNYQEVIIWLSSSVDINSSDYSLIYDGKELLLDNTKEQREIPISQLSNEQIEEFFNKAKVANIKSIEDRKKINADIEERYSKISDTYGVFLNIRNPLVHDYEGTHMGQGYKQSPKNSFGYVAARQVNKAIKEGHDGVVYENLYDPYLANNYGVFDPNQIKSADANIGTYSLENNNIYYQKTTDEGIYVDFLTNEMLTEFNLELNEEYTIDDIIKILPKINLPINKTLIKNLLKTASKVGIKYVFEVGPDNKTFGMSEGMKIHLYSTPSNPYFVHSLIHETIHSFLSYAIDNPDSDALTKKQKKAIKDLQDIFEFIKNENIDNKFGALNNIQEFVAELANPNVYNKLKEFKKPYKKENFFIKLWSIIKDILGISKTLNVEVENIIQKFLVKPSIYSEAHFKMTQEEIDETKQKEEDKQRELDLILQDTLQLNEQIKELSKSDLITMSEVKQLSFDIAYAISDLITQWQDNPEKFFENFPSKRTDNSVLDIAKIQSMSRAELVQFIGVKNLLDTVKELVFGIFSEGVNEDKVMLLYENFDALIRFGADAFGSVEDFQLRYSEVGFIVEDVKTDDETDALSNEEQAVKEELGDKQEHWQIDTRTIDNFLSMSQIVKRELVRCYQLDSNNNPKTNEFGINQRVNPREATSCILRWTQGSLTLADMITKLESKAITNPWIKPIISKLKDNSGKYTDFQSQFFGVFYKHFQEYYVVKEFKDGDKKVYRIMPINVNPALREVMSSIDVLYKMQKHPMFNSNGIIESQFRQLEKAVNKLKELQKQGFNNLDLEQISKGIAYCSELLGYYITPEAVQLSITEESFYGMLEDLSYIVFNLSKNLGKQDYDPFTFNKKANGIRGNLNSFLKPLTDILEDTALSSFFDSGKMYQSYIIPSHLTKLMKKLQHSDDTEFKKFMQEEYGKYEWFRDQSMSIDEPSSWKNHWLRQLYTMSAEDRKKNFGHKVQLSFLGHNYMRNMSGPEYVLSILTEYFSKEGDSKEASTTAWYKVPMMSNKPSLEFIKFTRHRGIGYETTLLDGFEAIFSQELARIITVKLRAYNKKDDRHIGGFDTNGDKFHFLNFLNKYLKEDSGTELGILLNKVVEGEQLSEEDSTKLSDLVRQEIASYMNERVNTIIEGYKSSGIFEAAKKIDGIGNTDEEIESALREFIWNDTFAAMNILQMTITDIAYYKNAEDLQKRLAQIHAPGIRPNVTTTDYQGNPVSDGKLRTIFLADYTGEDVVQNIIENLEVVFDRKISQAKTDAERDYWERTKESIIKTFREDINVADAQAYNCPTSYRKKALMFGKWNKKYEETYQKLRKGEYNASDLEIAFQPLKPFVYTNTEKQVGVEGAPLQTIKVGMQFKNAEYALILADALLQGEYTGKPNLLRALFEVMEASADKNPTKGIDTFMFASAVKAGLHGRINLSKFVEKGDAKGYIEDLIYGDGADGYNETYVHTFPAEDYSIQQEYSRHFLDHSQAHGSQERYIIPSDLEYIDSDGNSVLYEFEDNGKHRKLTADDFRKEYEDTIAENIENSIETLSEELGLNNSDIKTRNIALSKILQKEILSSPRYGMDLYFACSVDKDGNFNIPLGDPIQSKRIEQLINSIVKNRINKQKIAGGPVVQVSNFGMSRRLNIKFKDKQSNILPTLTEWLEENKGKTVEDYKDYLKENQAGIAYYECYAPVYMQEMFEDFMDENGNIDVEALQELNPELLDMIGYRIPTEDKYSIAPLKIVGFLPKEAGEALVLPYEITVIAGLDYDWDKFYLMRKEFIIKMKKIKDIKDSLINHFGTKRIKEIQDFIDKVLNPETRREAYVEHPEIAKQFRRVAFSIEKPTKGKTYRNNKVIDMSLAVLTHSTTADKILNPGGFEPQKRMGYLVSAYKILTEERLKQLQIENPETTSLDQEDLDNIWNSLYNMSTSSLKDICMTEKNLCFIDVNTQFYEQNNAAGSILGMFAVQKIAHAVLENNKLHLDVNAALKLGEEGSFTYMGKVFKDLMEFDGTKNFNGEYVGKVLGSLVASAADAVKDPVLNLMNINSTTANVLTTMIRFGIPFEDAALLLSQKVITDCLKEFNVKNLSGFTTFNTIVEEKIKQLKEEHNISDYNEINTEDLTKEELVRGLVSSDINVQYKTLLAFSKFMTLSKELKGPTYATRFNSISNAVGPLIIDNLIMENKLDTFSENIVKVVTDENGNEQTISISMEDILNEHPILKCFTKTLVIANNIFGDHMPLLSKSFKSVISSLPEELANKIYGDRKLLSKLADFYLSYLLVNSGCINTKSSKGLNYYINDFPKEFFDSKIKEKYPDNPFIQAIRIATTKDSAGKERFVLKLETTGMDILDKEKLSGGWEDLFRTDFNLAMKLFKYCFYKGGIGFNPKTFMHLLPTNVKELIPDYIKSFGKNNIVNIPEVVVDQFVRNNWNNSKISPLIKTDKPITKDKNNNIFIIDSSDFSKFKGIKYCRVKVENEEKLFKAIRLEEYGNERFLLEELTPLGNNGEYLEISVDNIETSMETPKEASNFNTDESMPESSDPSYDNESTSVISKEKQYIDLLIRVFPKGQSTIDAFRKRPISDKQQAKENYRKWFEDKFKELGIEFNMEEFDKLYETFCG